MRQALLLMVLVTGGSIVYGADAPLPKDHAERFAKGTVIYNKQVKQILTTHCLKCHGGEKTDGELEILTREKLLKGGDRGAAIVPFDSSKSLLFQMVNHDKKPVMPYKLPKLPAESITAIKDWIDNGAPFDGPLVGTAEANAWTTRKIEEKARQHWAYQPLKIGPHPEVKNATWVQNPIDRFILSKLEGRGLTPNNKADKRQILRRVAFNLTGLPPTAEDYAAFEKDNAPDALAKMIDKYLASDAYGERWARHWLDLARFAESHGFEHDYDRPTAYHYRDFVIKALNSDLPYNTFVKWQIAGDEIAPNDPQALLATGFLAAGPHSTQITKNEVEKHRYDELDDMLATTGTAFLGLTVGCARCHDHKFDAIPQADYYRMLSAFTATIRTDYDIDLDSDGYKKAKATHDAARLPLLAALQKYEMEELSKKLPMLEAKLPKLPATAWIIPKLASSKSAGGATLTLQPDGSILVSGKNPPIETLTFVYETTLKGLTGLQIEALADASLVKKGPGRAANGNFALTDLKVTIPGKDGKPQEVKLKNPKSTFDQKGLGVAGVLDTDPVTSAWAIDPQFGKDHAASFEFDAPIGAGEKIAITVVMKFHNNVGHGMGRPRLSFSTDKIPALQSPTSPEALRLAIDTPAEKRTPEQKALLLDFFKSQDEGWVALNQKLKDHDKNVPQPKTVKALISTEGLKAVRLHTQGEDVLKETHFLRRGDPNQKEGVAGVGYLQTLSREENRKVWETKPASKLDRLSYQRTGLANWITDSEKGAGMLTARVIVNRLWQHHFGRGIVSTPSDFGVRGEAPTHPELLDYLAAELIRNDWKLKPIQKLILLSATFQQSSQPDAEKAKLDRENLLLWRFATRRLEAESIRDSMLYVSNQLDPKMYGPGSLDEASKRRSVYFTMKRSKLIPMLTIFDAPDGTVGIGERPSTTIAPQALWLLNNPQARQWAKGFAAKVLETDTEDPAVIEKIYLKALTRKPTEDERKTALEFLKEQRKGYTGKDANMLAVADFCQTIFCLNEFIYID